MTELDILAEIDDFKRYNTWRFFEPYAKQIMFMELGKLYPERLMIAGNQVGKSDTGAYETACHMTGVYPPWWKGLRYDQNSGPCDAWVGGTSGLAVRDGPQKKLFGEPGVADLLGTGFIPKSALVGEPSSGRSATGGIDTAHVNHGPTGAISTLSFKTYEQDRRHWQGATKKFIWYDEEPPEEIYTEGLARLAATGGSHILTFTPLFGFSAVVRRFLECPPELAKRRTHVQMALTDAKHMTQDKIDATLSMYPRHEWAARRDGSPHLAGGLIFSASPEDLSEPPWALSATAPGLQLPQHWPLLWAVDFLHSGGDNSDSAAAHAFAAVLLAWDREEDACHILQGFKTRDGLPLVHADRIKSIAANVPVAWPHDGNVRDMHGDEIAHIYKRLGLNMLGSHATFVEGGYSTEAGLLDMENAMRRGKWKVNSLFADWFQEIRLYHRDKNGQIVKVNDDLMSASRIGWMARRFARCVPLGSKVRKLVRPLGAPQIDPWSGKVRVA